MKIKEKLNAFMAKIKAKNPNANWSNILTGLAVLFLVAAFSYSYFSRSKNESLKIEDKKIMEEINKGEVQKDESKEEKNGSDNLEGNQDETKKEIGEGPMAGEKGSTPSASGVTTVVQKGEGLWHVAKRVCGDGEKYNILAAANGLTVWDELNEGMVLKVVCE